MAVFSFCGPKRYVVDIEMLKILPFLPPGVVFLGPRTRMMALEGYYLGGNAKPLMCTLTATSR